MGPKSLLGDNTSFTFHLSRQEVALSYRLSVLYSEGDVLRSAAVDEDLYLRTFGSSRVSSNLKAQARSARNRTKRDLRQTRKHNSSHSGNASLAEYCDAVLLTDFFLAHYLHHTSKDFPVDNLCTKTLTAAGLYQTVKTSFSSSATTQWYICSSTQKRCGLLHKMHLLMSGYVRPITKPVPTAMDLEPAPDIPSEVPINVHVFFAKDLDVSGHQTRN